jgi:hypothetical protein
MNKTQVVDAFFAGISPLYYKNNGGCLFFTYAFWLWIKKNALSTKSFQIVQYDYYYKYDLTKNLNWIDDSVKNNCPLTKEHPSSANHFAWEFQRKEYDSEGPRCKDSSTRTVLKGLNGHMCLVDAFCIGSLAHSSWNRRFRREDAISHCEVSLGLDFEELKQKQYEVLKDDPYCKWG